MTFPEPTLLELLRELWWGFWNRPRRRELELPPIKKMGRCPQCKRVLP